MSRKQTNQNQNAEGLFNKNISTPPGSMGKGGAGVSMISSDTSRERDLSTRRSGRNQLKRNTLTKKRKKGTRGGCQAGGTKIKSDTSESDDQPEKLFGIDILDESTLPKKQKKGTTFKYKALKNQLQMAIADLNGDKCKSLMMTSTERELLPILCTVFKNALVTEKDGIKEVVFSQIAEFSADVIKKFRKSSNKIPKNAIIWMGTECNCDKTISQRYKDLPCFNTLPVIVVETNESESKFDKFEEFYGFPIRVIHQTTDKTEDNEAKTVLHKAVVKSNGCIVNHEIHASIGKYLFQRHCNLTMVCPSKWKSTGFNQKMKHEVEEIDCVNLFCKRKGIVPIGEHHFPLKIQGFPTDVLNGSSYLSATLKVGDNMKSDTGTGTLGGFVKYYGADTFLTCAHVIFGKDNLLDLQKDNIHFVCRKMTNEGSEPVECTLIRHALNYDTVTATEIDEIEVEEPIESQSTNVPETSVDAAMLLIQTASDISNTMVNLKLVLKDNVSSTKRNLKSMGIKSIYLNENKLPNPAVIQSKAVALSAITGEQRKDIKVKQVKELFIRYSTHARLSNNITVYNQLTIENMDFQSGDSGTCIYAICPRKEDSGCIGMLIGKSTSGQFVVTPIDEILKALGVH